MRIFLFHRDLRLTDNTTLLRMVDGGSKSITPIFIFTEEQIDPKRNPYFSNNLVQFMVESLEEMDGIMKGGLCYYYGKETVSVLERIRNENSKGDPITEIGFNIDYSPYAKKRDDAVRRWAAKHHITVHACEDHLLHPLLNGDTLKSDGTPYKVFTPFMRHCTSALRVASPSTTKIPLEGHKKKELDPRTLFLHNNELVAKGGTSHAMTILKNISSFAGYGKQRDALTYKTTRLSAHLNLGTVSIREVYKAMAARKNSALVRELYWRDFYINILHFFPHVVGKNFNPKFDGIMWDRSQKIFKAWKEGRTGFPVVDACMRELNTTGYMHNRGRMIVASFLIKDLLIDWREGEKYFATKLTDYNLSANNGGWQWSSGGGTDSQPYYRVFNPWTQSKKFDPDCEYIRRWLPELEGVDSKDIHMWFKAYEKHPGVEYPKPIVDHDEQRKLFLTRVSQT